MVLFLAGWVPCGEFLSSDSDIFLLFFKMKLKLISRDSIFLTVIPFVAVLAWWETTGRFYREQLCLAGLIVTFCLGADTAVVLEPGHSGGDSLCLQHRELQTLQGGG